MSKLLQVARRTNNLAFPNDALWLYIGHQKVGLVPAIVVSHLRSTPLFTVTNDRVDMLGDSCDKRSKDMNDLLCKWRAGKIFKTLGGWRNELFRVYGESGACLLEIERSGILLFGFRSFGCHLNGYTASGKMWVQRRSKTKQTWGGFLDNIVGGGLGFGLPTANMQKECWEEAGISKELSACVKSAGCVSFWYASEGWTAHTEYTFDLLVPESFIPKPIDGEVDSFHLLDEKQVTEKLINHEFTPESSAVILDFMIRHGKIDADTEPLIAIMDQIHVSFPFPYPVHK